MKGFQVVLFENATYNSDYRTPVGATKIVKWWFPTRKEAEKELSRVQMTRDGVAQIRS